MTCFRALSMFTVLAGCAAAPQKSLIPGVGYTDFRSALYIAAETSTSRTVVYIVALEDDGFGLVTYVGRTDGQSPGITRARSGQSALSYQRISNAQNGSMKSASGMIILSRDDFDLAARTGMALELCGNGTCYGADVPSALFQQALIE